MNEIDSALDFVICCGVHCSDDNCELCDCQGACIFDFERLDKKILADVARRRYEKREKTPELKECMRIINKAFPQSARVV